MNRRHTAADYRRIVDRLRAVRPDIALSSDFIVGFPGETDADFVATLELIEDVGFASSFSFKYSPRPGTPGADMPDQIDPAVMKARLAQLQALLDEQRHAFDAATVGHTVDVLLERRGRHPGQLTGKSPYLQQIQLEGPDGAIGSIVPVTVKARGVNSLFGSAVLIPARVAERQSA